MSVKVGNGRRRIAYGRSREWRQRMRRHPVWGRSRLTLMPDGFGNRNWCVWTIPIRWTWKIIRVNDKINTKLRPTIKNFSFPSNESSTRRASPEFPAVRHFLLLFTPESGTRLPFFFFLNLLTVLTVVGIEFPCLYLVVRSRGYPTQTSKLRHARVRPRPTDEHRLNQVNNLRSPARRKATRLWNELCQVPRITLIRVCNIKMVFNERNASKLPVLFIIFKNSMKPSLDKILISISSSDQTTKTASFKLWPIFKKKSQVTSFVGKLELDISIHLCTCSLLFIKFYNVSRYQARHRRHNYPDRAKIYRTGWITQHRRLWCILASWYQVHTSGFFLIPYDFLVSGRANQTIRSTIGNFIKNQL